MKNNQEITHGRYVIVWRNLDGVLLVYFNLKISYAHRSKIYKINFQLLRVFLSTLFSRRVCCFRQSLVFIIIVNGILDSLFCFDFL